MDYSFTIENENSSDIVKKQGPYNHYGPGNVSHCIDGLDKNSSYSVVVQVKSIAGNQDSNRTYLSKCTQHAIKTQELTAICVFLTKDMNNIKSYSAEGDMTTSDYLFSTVEQAIAQPMDNGYMSKFNGM